MLVIDPGRVGLMSRSTAAGDAAVFGIVVAEPGVVLGTPPPNPNRLNAAGLDAEMANFGPNGLGSSRG